MAGETRAGYLSPQIATQVGAIASVVKVVREEVYFWPVRYSGRALYGSVLCCQFCTTDKLNFLG